MLFKKTKKTNFNSDCNAFERNKHKREMAFVIANINNSWLIEIHPWIWIWFESFDEFWVSVWLNMVFIIFVVFYCVCVWRRAYLMSSYDDQTHVQQYKQWTLIPVRSTIISLVWYNEWQTKEIARQKQISNRNTFRTLNEHRSLAHSGHLVTASFGHFTEPLWTVQWCFVIRSKSYSLCTAVYLCSALVNR